jgi:hypothetical protein
MLKIPEKIYRLFNWVHDPKYSNWHIHTASNMDTRGRSKCHTFSFLFWVEKLND